MGVQSFLRDAPLIYRSEAFRQVLRLVERVAASHRPVLIEGESGTGKGRVARLIHQSGPRRLRPFTIWHAGESNPNLAMSDLFGVTKGAYTGSDRDAEGLIELTHGGTLLLDDVDKLPPLVQTQLLRFFDEGTGRRTGSTTYKPLDVRLVLTTNRNLRRLVERGLFLADLAYRIQGLQITIPPLRQRREDVRPLVEHLSRDLAGELADGRIIHFDDRAMTLLECEPWNGNVRELEEVVQKTLFNSEGKSSISADDVRRVLTSRYGDPQDEDSELLRLTLLPEKQRRSREVVTLVLRLLHGNGRRAAKALGIPERTFRFYLRKFGLTRYSRVEEANNRGDNGSKTSLESCTRVQ